MIESADTKTYLLSGPLSGDTPRELLPWLETIRTLSDWRATGITKIDRNGAPQSFERNGLYFTFLWIARPNDIERLAAATGKKVAASAANVLHWSRFGVGYDQFVGITEDITSYCEAAKLMDAGRGQEALAYAERAVAIRPAENEYHDLLYRVQLSTNDASAIDKALSYYQNDIDAQIHCGNVGGWLRWLAQHCQYRKLSEVVVVVNQLLDDLIAGRRTPQRYSSQRVEWYGYKKEQFNKSLSKSAFPGAGKILVDGDVESLLAAVETILQFEGPLNIGFLERVGDSCVHLARPRATRYYELAVQAARAAAKPKAETRILRKLGTAT